MNNFVTIKLFKTFDKVNFYTFSVEGRVQSEADNFFSRFENHTELADDLNVLVAWIVEIGQKRGALARYFRFENDAAALPPPARIMAELGAGYCSLRLYCVRLTDDIVILANGGKKSGRTVQDSPDLMAKFRFANKMARQVLEALQAGEIDIEGKQLTNLEEIELWD